MSIAPAVWVIGAVVGASALCLAAIVLVVRRCGRSSRKNSLDSLDIEDCLQNTSRSAPCTRATTPQVRRKESMPGENVSRSSLIRSVTVDLTPDLTLPPEPIQPTGKGICSETTTPYQQPFLTSFQPQVNSSSLDDDALENFGSKEVSGRLWFTVTHNTATEQLTVSIIKAKQLKGRGRNNGARDPFVKLYLLPDERTSQQTRVRKKTLNPKFNETFTFKVEVEDVSTRTLRMSIYDVDKRRVRHSLGHVIVPLTEIDLSGGEMMVRELQDMSQNCSVLLGEVHITLVWNPSTELIEITVNEAKNINCEIQHNIYVKVQSIHMRKTVECKETSRIPGNCNPVFNEAMSFSLPNKQLETASFSMIFFTESNGNTVEYGKVILGSYMHARGEDLIHWQEMLAQPRLPVARWHHLTPSDSPGQFHT